MKNQNNESTLVTIGIPNYNYGHYVIGAIESAVNQTYPNIELIIVDDFSTDNSVEVIEEWMSEYKGERKIRFIKNNQNQGLTKNCNIILNQADGEYFQILDADDIFFSEKIFKNIEVISSGENIALVYSNMSLMDQSGKLMDDDYLTRIGCNENEMPEGNIFEELFDFNFIAYPLINKKLAAEVGGFDESQQVHDYSVWLKLAEKYDIKYCPGKYALYRIHEESMSNSSKTNVRSIADVLATKFKYIRVADEPMKKIIKRDIYNSVTTLYANNFCSTGIWLKRNIKLNPGIKSIVYYSSYKLGIPFHFFNSLKKVFSGFRTNGK